MSLATCRMTLLGCGKAMLGLCNYTTPKGSPRSTAGRCVKWSFFTILETGRRFHRIDECRFARRRKVAAARTRSWPSRMLISGGRRVVFWASSNTAGPVEWADGPFEDWTPPINVARLIRRGKITESQETAIGGAAMLRNLMRHEKTSENARARGPQLDRLCRAVKSLSTADARRF